MKEKNMESKKIKSKNKFVIVMTIQNLIEEGYVFSENENGHIVVKNSENLQFHKEFKTEKSLQDWIDEESLNF
jgi:DNA-binding transcriptional regulator YhcF (GntR family)